MINDDVRKMFLWLQSKTKWSSVTQSLEDDDGADSVDSDNDEQTEQTLDSDDLLPPYEEPRWQQTKSLAQPPFNS